MRGLNETIKKYELKEVKEVPKGIKPKQFSTLADAEKFIESIKASAKDAKAHVEITRNIPAPSKSFAMAGMGAQKCNFSMVGSGLQKCNSPQTNDPYSTATASWIVAIPYLKMNLRAGYHYYYNDKLKRNCYRDCTGVTSDYTGIDFCVTWKQTSSNAQISEDGTKLTCHAEGNVENYLIVDLGKLMKIFTYHEKYSFTFTNP